ncbi:peptide MFS transporter [Leucobacter salsicius]|uniref:peptide MFS transporter n=1 Tax=Leucobacter salsicius TaxID=664638 RepID=UPI0003493470|nr:oligopeptide:H+ symporter [Leucobacter salsicius]
MANTRTPTPQRAPRGHKPSSRVGETRALGLVTEEARPSGLITLAGTEMWERFSFYGLQALLACYLYYSLADGGLGLPQAIALGIAGSYGGLVYIAQIVGAWIADRVLAPRLVVLIGGAAIMLGHLLLAFVPDVVGLVGGLALIVIGTGGLKVNTSMMVGQLYPEGGAKRDAGYSIYYMGITVGAFLGPLLTGILHQQWGFHVAFGAAAAGMAVGLVQYAVGMRKLPASTGVVPNPLSAQARVAWTVIAVIASLITALLILTRVVSIDNISSVVAIVVAAAAVLIFTALLTNPKVTFSERQTIVRYIPIFLMGLVFWTLLFQLFTAFTVYADTKVNLSVFGFTAPPSLIVTIESLFVAFITAALALLWSRSRNFRMSSVSKLVWGVVFMSLGAAAIVPFSVAPRGIDATRHYFRDHGALCTGRSSLCACRAFRYRGHGPAGSKCSDDRSVLPHHGGRLDTCRLGRAGLSAGRRGAVLRHGGCGRSHRNRSSRRSPEADHQEPTRIKVNVVEGRPDPRIHSTVRPAELRITFGSSCRRLCTSHSKRRRVSICSPAAF